MQASKLDRHILHVAKLLTGSAHGMQGWRLGKTDFDKWSGVQGGCNPQEKQKGWSLLHLAAALGLLDCLAFLLKEGCDVQGMPVTSSAQDGVEVLCDEPR